MNYKIFIEMRYNEIFEDNYVVELGNKQSNNAKKSAERKAQHEAMLKTFEEGYIKFSEENSASDIWNAIYAAHLKRKAGISDLNEISENVIKCIVSGDQSWRKCSGHVFEHFVVKYTKERLEKYNISFVLQKDLTVLLKENKINNEDDDMILELAKSENFDIYAIVNLNGSNIVYGCIQAKTSIRDRVGRDRDFSIPIMESHFWSPSVVLDGSFMSMPKFASMVNGHGETQYKENGWHGMYVMSNIHNNDRIYYDVKLDLLIEHANAAAQKFTSARQRFDRYWKALL